MFPEWKEISNIHSYLQNFPNNLFDKLVETKPYITLLEEKTRGFNFAKKNCTRMVKE